MTDWDVVVVGAGPAGALSAYELAKAGASVLLMDRGSFPRWKVCGACLSPGALEILEDAGLGGLASQHGGTPLERLKLSALGRSSQVALRGTLALSRPVLDAALVRAAEREGARFWPRARAALDDARPESRRLRVVRRGREVPVVARVVVDATGLGGVLRDRAEPRDEVAAESRVGLGARLPGLGYPVEPGDLHMAVGRSGYVGLVRVEDGTLNVAAAVDQAALRSTSPERVVSGVLAEAGLPALRERPLVGWRGTPSLTRRNRVSGGPRLFHVGDAAGYVEPFTGEGICWALSAARVAASLAAAGVGRWHDDLLEEWQAYLGGALAPSQRLCRVVAGALRRPRIVAAVAGALGVAPGLAAPFVSWAGAPPRWESGAPGPSVADPAPVRA